METFAGFALDQRRRGLAEGTIERRSRTLWSLYLHLGRDPCTATTVEIEEWLDGLDLSAEGSRYLYLSTLGMFYRWATRTGLCAADPTADIPRPRLTQQMPRPVPDRDFAYALSQAGDRMRSWLLLAFHAGLRCKEIALLRREAILDDRQTPILIVERAAAKGANEGVVGLHSEVLDALYACGLPARGYVFRQESGRPYKPGTVSTYINRHFRDCGLPYTAHQGRHTLGTRVYRATKDPIVTQRVLRHRSLRQVLLYAACEDDAPIQAVRSLPVQRHFDSDPLAYKRQANAPPPTEEAASSTETAPTDWPSQTSVTEDTSASESDGEPGFVLLASLLWVVVSVLVLVVFGEETR